MCTPMWAIVPIKDLGTAKQRLADVLDEYARRRLCRAMTEDVLSALAEIDGLDGILVVTSDPDVKSLAGNYRAQVLDDSDCKGLNAAVRAGISHLKSKDVKSVMIVHGDAPFATADEFQQVIETHAIAAENNGAVTIVPARDMGGTNCMAITPPDLLPLCYGEGSYRKHLNQAANQGIAAQTLKLQGIGLDIDTRADLEVLVATPGDNRAQRVLLNLGVTQRLNRPDNLSRTELSA
jgi:2-phospho-L-lactate guanylyltransferase